MLISPFLSSKSVSPTLFSIFVSLKSEMGASRKTKTVLLKEKSKDSWKVNSSAPARNLSKVELGSIIFGCKHSTIKECLEKELFGLLVGHYSYVKKATPGLTLFLFNYSDRKLHGIFEAVSSGQMNINPNAWITAGEGAETTPYPAQVRIRARCRCRPLVEEEMKPIIADNYYTEKLFWFELDKEQTKRLMTLFQSSPWPVNMPRPSKPDFKKNIINVPSSSGVFKAADEEFKDVAEEHFAMAQARFKENKHSNDSFSPGKKWSELFKPSSSTSAVNHAEVLEPQKVLNPSTSECLDVEWECASDSNAWSELPSEGVLLDVQSSDFQYVITKAMQEIEELKVSQFNQSLKIETLEQELVHSKQEIDELKKRCQKLDGLLFSSGDQDCASPISKSSN